MSEDKQPEELIPANENPWYCLATLYGEQRKAGIVLEYDRDLAAKNRMAWNRWIAGDLSNEQRAALVEKGFAKTDLEPLTSAEKKEFLRAFSSRLGQENANPPEPDFNVDFTNTCFDAPAVFDSFLFNKETNFKSATFSKMAYFDFAIFSGVANFEGAKFRERAVFLSAIFSTLAYFHSAKFHQKAYFGLARFFQNAIFSSATFSQNAEFSSATFSYAQFDSATFCQQAKFAAVKFYQNADFASSMFSGQALFNDAKFSGNAFFPFAKFSENLSFLNAEFESRTVFAGARFCKAVPDFRGAKMHEATEWHDVKKWPDPPDNRTDAQPQVYAYERLKQEMERLKKHYDEQFFFRKELRARRGLEPPKSLAWWINYIYELLSDYGQSIVLPVFWLFILFIFGIVAQTKDFTHKSICTGQAARFSFANIFSFLPIKRAFLESMDTGDLILCAFQSIIGALLLFLLGLALRSRFRMR